MTRFINIFREKKSNIIGWEIRPKKDRKIFLKYKGNNNQIEKSKVRMVPWTQRFLGSGSLGSEIRFGS